MSFGKKIASSQIKNRTSTPLFAWIRRKLLATDRDLTKTPPPGIPDSEGKVIAWQREEIKNTLQPVERKKNLKKKIKWHLYF